MPAKDTIPIDGEIRKRLRALRDKTGIGPYALLRGHRSVMPDGLSGAAIASWIVGNRKAVRRDQLDFVIALWERQAGFGTNRIALTQEHLDAIRKHRQRTGVELKTLFRASFKPPAGLTVQMVQNWLQGAVKTVRKDHLDFVLSTWRGLPDVFRPDPQRFGVADYEIARGRIIISRGISDRLHELRAQSGCSGTELFNEARRKSRAIPDGLTVPEIARWLSGQAKSVDPAHLLFVVDMFEELALSGAETVTVGASEANTLKAYRDGGLTARHVLGKDADVPKGLSAAMVNGLLSGRSETARKDHVQWLLARCEHIAGSSSRRIEITPETRERLEAAREKSGVSQSKLIKGAHDVPDGLRAATITQWINGYIKTARKDWLDWVIERWERG